MCYKGMAIHAAGSDVVAKLANLATSMSDRLSSVLATPASLCVTAASIAAMTKAGARVMPTFSLGQGCSKWRAAARTRLVGAFAAGRVVDPRLVRSQCYGGMI